MTKSSFVPSSKPVGEKIIISVRLDESLLRKIDSISGGNNISRNEFINECINFAIDNIDKEKMKITNK